MGGYIGSRAVNLSTTAADVTGNATIGGNLTVTGTTVTIDSANAQTVDLGDNDKIRLGDGDDLQLYHDGSNSHISNATGNLTLDVSGDISLDADGGDIRLLDGGTQFGKFTRSSGDFIISASENDKDMKFAGADGGADITALTLDMSAAGAATFNAGATFNGDFNLNGDGNRLFINSADYEVAMMGRRGSSGANLDQGYIRLKNAGTNTVIIDSAGDSYFNGGSVGIGTSSPAYTLSVEKDVDTWASRIYNTGSDANASGLLVRTDATAAHNANAFAVFADSSYKLMIKSDGNIGVNTTAPVDFGDNFKNLNLNGVKGGALSFTRGTNSATRQWDIYTSDSDQLIFYRGGSTDGMVMKSDGTISVNHSTPLSTFHVRDSGATSGSLRVGGNGASLGLELLYDQSGSTVSTIQANPTYTSDAQLLKIRSDGDRNTNQLVLKGDGNIGINTANPVRKLNVSAGGMSAVARFDRSTDGSQRAIMEFLSASSGSTVGEIKITSTTAHYTSASDYRLKENVVELTSATNRLKQLKPKRFNFIADADTTIDGFLAHEAQAVVPEAVSGTKDEVDDEENPVYQGIDQAKLVPLLVAAIKELEARITTLEAK